MMPVCMHQRHTQQYPSYISDLMPASAASLFARLADGRVHSGAQLADALGISRQAVWKQTGALREMGLDIKARAGRGYQLARPVERLDESLVNRLVKSAAVSATVVGAVNSTNQSLLEARAGHGRALLAETQLAGRGRRGRSWVSPPGSGLYVSLAWEFDCGLTRLAPLSLVVGLAAAQCLRPLSGAPASVKWPNDLFIGQAKFGGCLVEISGAAEGPCRAVVGIGINLFSNRAMGSVEQAWTTLEDHGNNPGRNRLAAALLDGLASALEQFEADGFAPFHAEWDQYDALAGLPVRVIAGQKVTLRGTAAGIDKHGQLLVRCDGQIKTVAGGEVSVRVD